MIYKGKFVSRDNYTYEVEIRTNQVLQSPSAKPSLHAVDDDMSEEVEQDAEVAVELKLGVPPFTVKYEGTSDLNKPLKLSDATLNIVTSSIPWDIVTQKANDISVKLVRKPSGSTPERVMWVGFVDPKVYTMGADKNIEEFQVNCIDCLTSLEYRYYAKGNDEKVINPRTKSFYDVIKDALEGLPYKRLFFPQMYKYGTVVLSIEDFFVNEKAFIDDKALSIKADGTTYVDYSKNDTYKEVLEKLMLYLNLTMLADGEDIYCLPVDYLNWDYNYSVYDLATDNVTNARIKSSSILTKLYQPTSYSLTEQYNQVIVTAKMQEYSSLIPDLFDDRYLTNTTQDSGEEDWTNESNWGATITQNVTDNQKGGKRVTDKCRWQFFKHAYYHSHYYNGTTHLADKTEINTLNELKTLSCGQIMRYGMANVPDNDSEWKDHTAEGSLTNYVYMGTYAKHNLQQQPVLETDYLPDVFVFDNSYLNLSYEIQFRPDNGSPWHLPSSWIQYSDDAFNVVYAYLDMQISCKVDGIVYYYYNEYLYRPGTWVTTPRRCTIPFQCADKKDHLYGTTWKNFVNSGIAGNEGTENGYIIKPPSQAVGKFAQFKVVLNYHLVYSKDVDHDTQGTWLKNLSLKMQIPRDQSIKDWKADSEYSAVISDQYVKEGEKIEMKINTFDNRVPSYTCVLVNVHDEYKIVDKLYISGLAEPAHKMEEWKIFHKVCQHNTPRKVLSTTIEGGIQPFGIYIHDGENYIPNQWEVDYYDNKTNIELIELWSLTTE